MHDLVRLHATRQANRNRPAAYRRAAVERLVDHYLHTAYAGERVPQPLRPAIELSPPVPNCHPQSLPDAASALAWFDQEHTNLLAVQDLAASHGLPHAVWQLAWTLLTFHARRGHLPERLTVWRSAVTAARHLSDRAAQSLTHRYLGYACAEAGRTEEALEQLGHALTLADQTRDLSNQAAIHHSLARAWEQRGDHRALTHAKQALRHYETAGDTAGRARILDGVPHQREHGRGRRVQQVRPTGELGQPGEVGSGVRADHGLAEGSGGASAEHERVELPRPSAPQQGGSTSVRCAAGRRAGGPLVAASW
jgi:tetratricopeptide (TPR) repeat protein